MLRSIIATVVTFAYIIIVGTPFVLHAMLTGKTDTLYDVGVAGTKLALWLGGVRLAVKGKENIPPGRAVVFMPNHQSNCDPPAVVSVLPYVLIMIKHEFFRIPVLGRAMLLRGFIPVERQNRERAIKAVERAGELLKAGHSFLVYPEGTRSPDGRLQAFKKGVFMMAMNAGAPIIPISVSGSHRIMRKGDMRVHPGTVRITFHPPVPTEGTTIENRPQIMEDVRKAILSGLTHEEQPLSE